VSRDDISDIVYGLVPTYLEKPKLVMKPASRDAVEPNLDVTQAPAAWRMGYTGQGVVVGEVDTGIWYTHADLARHLWTSSAYPHPGFNYASHILFPTASNPSPNDTLDDIDYTIGHGTHCAGIVSADGTYGNGTHDTMGVAPSARMLVCNALVYFNSDGAGETLLEQSVLLGFQFCISPPRDPTNGADVITTSLGVPDSYHPRYANYRAMEQNIEAAGVTHCVAAGNEGPTPQTIRCMGDCPPPWPNPANNPTDTASSAVITVGATDNSDNAASFTSIGPSVIWGNTPPYNDYVYPPGLMDPDVCAPGVNITSTFWEGDSAYTQMSGTSMATPATAGCVALMLSKNPKLTPREVDSILECCAVRDLGPSGKDVTYGAGRIDCSLAVAYTPLPTGIRTLHYVIDDSAGGNNDHVINPGETINLPLWVMNLNGYTTLGVRGYLRQDTTDPNVTLLDTIRYFGNINVDDSAYTGLNSFKFSVANGCTNGYALRLSLVCKDTLDSVWVNPLGLHVGAASLLGGALVVHDPPPGGNSNGKLDPGETASVEIGIHNGGGGNAADVGVILVSGDSRLQILDSIGTYGAIPHDTTVFNSADQFRVHADASIPREFVLPCTLRITATGYSATRFYQIPCGALTSVDPIPDGPRTPALYYAYDDVDGRYGECPTYNWIELRNVGTRLTLSDDQTVQLSLPTGFGAFSYYGVTNTQVSVCGNGYIMPGSSNLTAWTNTGLPTTTMTAPLLCVNWDDLYPPTGGGVWYMYDTTNHCFVVEWDSVAYYSQQDSFDKFEVLLFDSTLRARDGNNKFEYQYYTANNYVSNTVGEQDPTEAIGIQALFNGAYHRACATIVAGRAIKFSTDSVFTGVSESPSNLKVLKLALRAPSNPFRGAGRIQFSLPSATRTRLVVYDISGRQTRVLLSSGGSPLKAGTYNLVWDGNDDAGRHVAGGIYFYRLETGLGVLARKTVKLD
jgi:subtilisin family serine protease